MKKKTQKIKIKDDNFGRKKSKKQIIKNEKKHVGKVKIKF